MKVMVVWKTVPGKYRTAVEEFLRGGGQVPAGAKTLGRWSDVLVCDVYPVIEDAEAGAAAKKAFGK
jgi:hypothetical protein